MLERVERNEIQNARAERQSDEFGDVAGQLAESRDRCKDGFERDDGDERDNSLSAPPDLRVCRALDDAQRFIFPGPIFRSSGMDKEELSF